MSGVINHRIMATALNANLESLLQIVNLETWLFDMLSTSHILDMLPQQINGAFMAYI